MEPEIDLPELVEDLEANIDDLETALAPLLDAPLSRTAATLPLLDKAKFYTLSAYAIESLIFQALQTAGEDAKQHGVFGELARLKERFAKIQAAETAGERPTTRLDKEAAGRFIRHGLAGNDRYDAEKAERIAKEKARAALKARQLVNKKFDDKEEAEKQAALAKKRKAEDVAQSDEDDSSDSMSVDSDDNDDVAVVDHGSRDHKASASEEEDHVESENEDFYGQSTDEPAKKKQRVSTSAAEETPKSDKKRSRTKKGKGKGTKTGDSKHITRLAERSAGKGSEELIHTEHSLPAHTSSGAPPGHSETFTSLLDGTFAEKKREKQEKSGKKKKKKSKK